jgi:transcriptional regulator with XRE-family HTH domain
MRCLQTDPERPLDARRPAERIKRTLDQFVKRFNAAQSINFELMRQLQDDACGELHANNPRMSATPPDTFNTRFIRLKEQSGLSFEALSQAIAERTGISISHAALHKYASGGNIDEPTLEALSTYFGKSPAWFRYGVDPDFANTFEVIGEMVEQLPHEPKQMVLNLLKYEFADSAAKIVSEPGVSVTYTEFVERVLRDMDLKRAADRRNGRSTPQNTDLPEGH